MRYGVSFLVLGVSCALLGALAGPYALAPLSWVGACFAYVGVAYLARRPGLLGKRADGSIGRVHAAALSPFLGFAWGVSRLSRWVSREAACDEVAPGLWVARRPARGDALPAGVSAIVDVTAELARGIAVAEGVTYLCVPTLDGTAPAEDALSRVLALEGGVYVHCASGHGRSATVAALMLIARGLATDAASAEARLRAARPGVRLHAEQRAFVDEVRGRLSR